MDGAIAGIAVDEQVLEKRERKKNPLCCHLVASLPVAVLVVQQVSSSSSMGSSCLGGSAVASAETSRKIFVLFKIFLKLFIFRVFLVLFGPYNVLFVVSEVSGVLVASWVTLEAVDVRRRFVYGFLLVQVSGSPSLRAWGRGLLAPAPAG